MIQIMAKLHQYVILFSCQSYCPAQICLQLYLVSLTGEASVSTPLSWHRRLKIALDSAQGMYDYKHVQL
jgi:hypothetical protein